MGSVLVRRTVRSGEPGGGDVAVPGGDPEVAAFYMLLMSGHPL